MKANDLFVELARKIESEIPGADTELTQFPSGGVMLDVHRGGRLFVMAFTPMHGYGVDEVGPEDGFLVGYEFTSENFAPAADQLRMLVSTRNTNAPTGHPHR